MIRIVLHIKIGKIKVATHKDISAQEKRIQVWENVELNVKFYDKTNQNWRKFLVKMQIWIIDFDIDDYRQVSNIRRTLVSN